MDIMRLLQEEIKHFEQLLQEECDSEEPSNLVRAYYRGALDGLRAFEEDLREEVRP